MKGLLYVTLFGWITFVSYWNVNCFFLKNLNWHTYMLYENNYQASLYNIHICWEYLRKQKNLFWSKHTFLCIEMVSQLLMWPRVSLELNRYIKSIWYTFPKREERKIVLKYFCEWVSVSFYLLFPNWYSCKMFSNTFRINYLSSVNFSGTW